MTKEIKLNFINRWILGVIVSGSKTKARSLSSSKLSLMFSPFAMFLQCQIGNWTISVKMSKYHAFSWSTWYQTIILRDFFLDINWTCLGIYWHSLSTWLFRTSGGFLMAQWVKNLPEMQETQETWVHYLHWEDPLEEEMATPSSILAWRIPWTEDSGRL